MSSGEIATNFVGRLTHDPDLRYTPAGHAVATLRVASSPRRFDRATNAWVDGDTTFTNVQVWRQQAENVTESLKKGMGVMISGVFKQRSYDTPAGEKRTVYDVVDATVGVDLSFQVAVVSKSTNANPGNATSPGASRPAPQAAPQAQSRPPASAPTAGGFNMDEPPF